MNDGPQAVNDALDSFARVGPFANRDTLAPLLNTSGAARAARDPRFRDGVNRYIAHIRSEVADRAQALAAIWRLTSVTAMREHRRYLMDGLKRGVPVMGETPNAMSDPDDRRHLGDAMSAVTDEWVPSYLAAAIARERDGEKAREAFTRTLVLRVPELSTLIRLLREALSAVTFDQQDQAAGRARRLAAIFDTLARGIWSTEVDVIPGSNFGSELAGVISDTLAKRPPHDSTATELAANSIVQFMVVAVRLHGTLAASAGNYAFLEPLRRSLGRTQWPETLRAGLDRLAAQVLEQLLFLVKLKIPDNDLRRVYVSIVGEVTARLRLARVTENADDIDTDLIFWLRTGSHRRSLPTQRAVEETAVAAVDRDLALAYREAESLRSGLSGVETEALSAAEFHSPRLKDELETAFSHVTRLVAYIASAARRRHLVLKGNVGDVVDFSPMEHEPSPDAKGSRVVRIRTRVVERILDGQSMGVVLKGDVEPG